MEWMGINREVRGCRKPEFMESPLFNWWKLREVDILSPMSLSVEHSLEGLAKQAWLDALPRKRVREAEAALAILPTEIVKAGTTLPLVIAAWSCVDPEQAASLLEDWLATADAEGKLSPPCIGICQMAGCVVDALPDPDPFLSRILPGLTRCIERELDFYDLKGTGLPLWPSEEESLFPSEFSPGRFTVDLAVLLSNEASVFCRLAEGVSASEKALDQAEGEQRDLDGWLQDHFWNEEEGVFYRYEEGGRSLPDFSPCGFFPLVWRGRTPEMTEGVRPRTLSWNPAAWPPRAWIFFFALLLRTPHHSVMAQMRASGLPEGASDVEAAVWSVLTDESELLQTKTRGEISSAVRWLDAHRGGLTRGVLIFGMVLFVGLLGCWVFHRESVQPTAIADLARRAQQAGEEGQHDRAAALYGQAAQRGRETYFRYRQAGEWMRMGEAVAAERAYRDLLLREPDAPNVQLNLALSIWQQGRHEEALMRYRAFAEENPLYPELVARARLAIQLMERQMDLDREKKSKN